MTLALYVKTPPTLMLGECDNSIATAMATSADTFDVGLSLVPDASSSFIHAPTIPKIDIAVTRSCLKKLIPLSSIRFRLSSVIDCDSAVKMIDSLFSRLNQRQTRSDRYGDMEAELTRLVARDRQLEKMLQKIRTSTSPIVTFAQVKYDSLHTRPKLSRNGQERFGRTSVNPKPKSTSRLTRSKNRPLKFRNRPPR